MFISINYFMRVVESPFHLIEGVEKVRALNRDVKGKDLTIEHIKLVFSSPITSEHLRELSNYFVGYLSSLRQKIGSKVKLKHNELIIQGIPSGFVSFKVHPSSPKVIVVHASYNFSPRSKFHLSRFFQKHVSEELVSKVHWWHE